MQKKDSSSIEKTSIQAYRAIPQGEAEGANHFDQETAMTRHWLMNASSSKVIFACIKL